MRKRNEAESMVQKAKTTSTISPLDNLMNKFNKESSAMNEKYSLWFFVLITPYVIGFILITVLCLSLVDITLDTYFTVLMESFSLIGLWTIGYFILSLLVLAYAVYYYLAHR